MAGVICNSLTKAVGLDLQLVPRLVEIVFI